MNDEEDLSKETEKEHPVKFGEKLKEWNTQESNEGRGSRGQGCSIASNAAHIVDNIKTCKWPLNLAKWV